MHRQPLSLALVALVALLALPARGGVREEGVWERFPAPPDGTPGARQAAVDAEGGLWMATKGRCYYWQQSAERWERVLLGDTGTQATLFATRDTGLYAAGFGMRATDGSLYRLLGGKALRVTAIQRTRSTSPPGLHINSDGRVVNWTADRLRLYANGKWQEWEMPLEWAGPLFESEKCLALYDNGVFHVIDAENRLAAVGRRAPMPAFGHTGALLGTDVALTAAVHSGSRLSARRLADGEEVEIRGMPSLLGRGLKIEELVSAPDGSVLAFLRTRGTEDEASVCFRIALDGTATEVPGTKGLLPPQIAAARSTRWFLPLNTNRTWFACGEAGVFCVDGAQRVGFDCRTDGSPSFATGFVPGPGGMLYAVGDDRLYAYRPAAAGTPRPTRTPPLRLGEPAWRIEHEGKGHFAGTNQLGDCLVVRTYRGASRCILVIDLATRRPRFSIPEKADEKGQIVGVVVSPGRKEGEFAVASAERLEFVDARTGRVIDSVSTQEAKGTQNAPCLLANDRFLFPGRWPTCLDQKGKIAWTWQGYDRPRDYFGVCVPVGNRVILQRSGEGYTVGATCAVDAMSGDLLWSSPERGRTLGVVAVSDGTCIVETRETPPEEAALLRFVCRDVADGRSVWEYRHVGTGSGRCGIHAPTADALLAYLGDGTVLCLAARTGQLLWQRRLEQAPLGQHVRDRRSVPAEHPLCVDGELVLATDRTGSLTVLGIHTGAVLAQFSLTRSGALPGSNGERERVQEGAWLHEGRLIVASSDEICAYPFPEAELRMAAAADRPRVPGTRPTAAEAVPSPVQNRYWERFPKPEGVSSMVDHVAIDASQCLWIVTAGECWHWDKAGKAWRAAEIPDLRADVTRNARTQLRGSPKTGLYMTRLAANMGHVYRLLDGKIERLISFPVPNREMHVELFAGDDGRLVVWSGGKIRIRKGEVWQECEAEPPLGTTSWIEHDGTICLSARNVSYGIDDRNAVWRMSDGKTGARAAWRKLFWGTDTPTAQEKERTSFDGCGTDGSVQAETVCRLLRLSYCHPLLIMPDRSMLAYGSLRDRRGGRMCRVWPDGRSLPIGESEGISWDPRRVRLGPRSALAAADGDVWFAHPTAGVIRLSGQHVETFAPDANGSPAAAQEIVQGADGVLYAVGGGYLYAYNQGTPVAGLERPGWLPPSRPEDCLWSAAPEGERRVESAWIVGDLAVFATTRGSSRRDGRLRAVEMATGAVRANLGVGEDNWPVQSVQAGWRPGELVIASRKRIVVVDTASGKTGQSIGGETVKGEIRHVALLPGGRMLVACEQLYCLDREGHVAWTRAASSDSRAMVPAPGAGVVVFLSGGVRGDGPTVEVIDGTTGRALWQRPTEMRGHFAILSDDGRHLVEAGVRSDDGKATTCVVCRRAADGVVLWEHRRPGTMPAQPPAVDPTGRQVYVSLVDGTVRCLTMDRGDPVWTVQLPRTTAWRSWARDETKRARMLAQPGSLAVLDTTGELNLLSPTDGKALARLTLANALSPANKWVGRAHLVTPPWLTESTLVVATMEELRAYRSPALPFQPQDPPAVSWSIPPSARSETGGLEVAVAATGGKGKLVLSHRLDDGPWKQAPVLAATGTAVLEDVPNGTHRLRIRVLDERGCASGVLEHDFEVAVDYGPRVEALVRQLGAASFAERKAAREHLLVLGNAALPRLLKLQPSPDPEVRHAIAEILERLRPAPDQAPE